MTPPPQAPSGTTCPVRQAPSRLRLHLAGDADEHAQNLSHWNQTYDQISPGRFQGRVTELWLEHAQVFVETANQRLRQTCSAWPGALWLGIPAPLHDVARLDGRALQHQEVAVRQGGETFELRTAADFDLYGIVVEVEALMRHLDVVERFDLRPLLRGPGVFCADPHARQCLCAWLGRHLAIRVHDPCVHVAPANPDVLEAQLFTLLASMLVAHHAAHGAAPGMGYGHRLDLVRRVSDHVLEHAESPASVAELCQRFGVSRRTLQYCFLDITGAPPLAYLRALRLNAVRRELRSGQCSRVGDCAWHWGFGHFSQFARDYARQFGELPSEALRRAH
ncbi:HTH-type transcriptional activator RhaS [mine drainage metagenome]|uniref:HTH-type transcriptional activator RhaS n=1 Tax=mine drainage metagenome TaxID=410659 RepID=A0A1J5QBM3_9ZZZZ